LLVATFLGVAKLIQYNLLKKWKEDVKRDLEILQKLDENHYCYKTIKASVDLSLLAIYSRDHKPWYSLRYKKIK
jgi:hypothetical protein